MTYEIVNDDGWKLRVYNNTKIVETYAVATQKSAEILRNWLLKKEKHSDSLSLFYHSMCKPCVD